MTTRDHSARRRLATAAAATAAGAIIALAPAAILSAHTEASAVAVPAGSTATVTFAPEHGCGESPTVAVRIQAPVAGATAEAVDGWTASATADGAGHTVLEWTGGSLPADEAGAFPVEFLVPDAVGTLLAFPAVQRCADGQELAWIGTAPGDEFPAPQVLVLAAGSEPAATIDDVPADAPGRELLVALAASESDDDAAAPAPTTAAPTTAAVTTTAAPTTAAPTTAAPATTAAPTTSRAASTPTTGPPATAAAPTTTAGGDGGSATGWIVAVVVAVLVVGGVAIAIVLRRRAA